MANWIYKAEFLTDLERSEWEKLVWRHKTAQALALRHGSTGWFATLEVATGRVIGKCHRRHRQQEFLKSLRRLDQVLEKEPGQHIHLVLDNYETHKTPAVTRWFARHPEYHVHFIPTSASWLNQVERFFAEITLRRIRCGVIKSLPAFEKAIRDRLEEHNQHAKPFQWTAEGDGILHRAANACERIKAN